MPPKEQFRWRYVGILRDQARRHDGVPPESLPEVLMEGARFAAPCAHAPMSGVAGSPPSYPNYRRLELPTPHLSADEPALNINIRTRRALYAHYDFRIAAAHTK